MIKYKISVWFWIHRSKYVVYVGEQSTPETWDWRPERGYLYPLTAERFLIYIILH